MYGEVDHHRSEYFTEFREWSSGGVTDVRDSGIPWDSHNAPMPDDLRETRLAAFETALQELIDNGVVTSLNDWVKKARVGWSTVNEFRTGDTGLMSDRTYFKLATAVGWSVARLKGEPEADDAAHEAEIAEIMKIYDGLNEERRARLKENARDLLAGQQASEQRKED